MKKMKPREAMPCLVSGHTPRNRHRQCTNPGPWMHVEIVTPRHAIRQVQKPMAFANWPCPLLSPPFSEPSRLPVEQMAASSPSIYPLQWRHHSWDESQKGKPRKRKLVESEWSVGSQGKQKTLCISLHGRCMCKFYTMGDRVWGHRSIHHEILIVDWNREAGSVTHGFVLLVWDVK